MDDLIRRCLIHHEPLEGEMMRCPREHPSYHLHAGHLEPHTWEVFNLRTGEVEAIVHGDYNVRWAVKEPESEAIAGRDRLGIVVGRLIRRKAPDRPRPSRAA